MHLILEQKKNRTAGQLVDLLQEIEEQKLCMKWISFHCIKKVLWLDLQNMIADSNLWWRDRLFLIHGPQAIKLGPEKIANSTSWYCDELFKICGPEVWKYLPEIFSMKEIKNLRNLIGNRKLWCSDELFFIYRPDCKNFWIWKKKSYH